MPPARTAPTLWRRSLPDGRWFRLTRSGRLFVEVFTGTEREKRTPVNVGHCEDIGKRLYLVLPEELAASLVNE